MLLFTPNSVTSNDYKILHSLDTIELYFFSQQCPDKTSGPGITCHRWHIKMASNTDSCKEAVFPHIYYPLYGHEAPAPDSAPPQSDNPPRFADIILNKGMAHYISYRVIDQALISDKCFRSIGSYIHIPFTACCVVYRTAKHTPDILNIALQHKRSRELSVRDDLPANPFSRTVLAAQVQYADA